MQQAAGVGVMALAAQAQSAVQLGWEVTQVRTSLSVYPYDSCILQTEPGTVYFCLCVSPLYDCDRLEDDLQYRSWERGLGTPACSLLNHALGSLWLGNEELC